MARKCRACQDSPAPVKRKDLRRSLQSLSEAVGNVDRQVDARDSQIVGHLYGVMTQLANIIQRIESSNDS